MNPDEVLVQINNRSCNYPQNFFLRSYQLSGMNLLSLLSLTLMNRILLSTQVQKGYIGTIKPWGNLEEGFIIFSCQLL
jgi:hypothetical protein